MKDLQSLRLYTRVARLGSFSAAARECGLVQSQASRLVADLEATLGVKLLFRTTRAVVPTEAGSEFLARIEPVLAALEDAENSVREGGELRGLLRVAMPTTMGVRMLLPRLSRFTARHPGLRIDVLLEDRWQDMVRDAVDVGIRMGVLADAAGTARLLATTRRVIVASPAYLKRAGKPRKPADLRAHQIVGGPATAQATSWQFERNGEKITLELRPQVSVNDNSGAVAAAAGGLGITSVNEWSCGEEVRQGLLVPLLREWRMADMPVHAYFPMGRATRIAARAFADFLAEEFRIRSQALSRAGRPGPAARRGEHK